MPDSVMYNYYPSRIRINGAYITKVITAQDVVVLEQPQVSQYIRDVSVSRPAMPFGMPRLVPSDRVFAPTTPSVSPVATESVSARDGSSSQVTLIRGQPYSTDRPAVAVATPAVTTAVQESSQVRAKV